MRMYDIIKKKRDGGKLSEEEIRFFTEKYTEGEIPDYQAAALCMAIYYSGMDAEETAQLTFAIRDSGEKLSFPGIKGIRVDKHSTGGVGDKTSLIIAPAVASLGVKIAKISGRGLGHTGGTVDKLESIPGFRTSLGKEEFERIVNEVGIAIVGQSADIAPADRKLYALRDVTATVDSMPLIASSIMGKKLAADDDCIVLDVKTGSGSFMKTEQDSRKLAMMMTDIGRRAGKKTEAVITDMDVPLGNAVGNSLEVKEAVEVLKGKGPSDLTEVCETLATEMLFLAGKGTREECLSMLRETVRSGKALDTFAAMVKAQGGDESYIYDTGKFETAGIRYDVKAERSGYIRFTDAEKYGIASLTLGAGRNTKEEEIDYSAGIIIEKKTGDRVGKGDVICTLYTNRPSAIKCAEETVLGATEIGDEPVGERRTVLGIV